MSLRGRIQEWLGITAIHTRLDAASTGVNEARSAARDAAIAAAKAQAFANAISLKRNIPVMHDVKCPACSRVYAAQVPFGFRSSLVCHCKAHLEIFENGEVERRA